VDFYGKVSRRWKKLIDSGTLKVTDITEAKLRSDIDFFVSKLKKIADDAGLEIFSCAEKVDLSHLGVNHGSCIDANLINRVFNLSIQAKKDKNQRKECLCTESVDIGMYNTCPFLCSYCYANY
jgi:hypothetical protein